MYPHPTDAAIFSSVSIHSSADMSSYQLNPQVTHVVIITFLLNVSSVAKHCYQQANNIQTFLSCQWLLMLASSGLLVL